MDQIQDGKVLYFKIVQSLHLYSFSFEQFQSDILIQDRNITFMRLNVTKLTYALSTEAHITTSKGKSALSGVLYPKLEVLVICVVYNNTQCTCF